MAIDTHIKFKGVEGESAHEGHKGEIQVLSWSHGVTNQAFGSGGGQGKGKAEPGAFNFSHTYDKASPILMKKCAEGNHFDEVVLMARKSGTGQKDFLKVTLKEVFITSIQPGGGHGGDIVENVALSYASIDYSYKAQDDKGGMTGEVKFGWNVKTTAVT